MKILKKDVGQPKNAGLEIHLTMMVGYPWETRAEAEITAALANRLMRKGFASMLQSTVVIPYPGTALFEEAVQKNWFLIDSSDYEKMDMSQPVLKTPDMLPQDITGICRKIYRSFLSPAYLFRQTLKIRNFDDVRFYLRGLKPVFGHLSDFKRKQG